MRRWNRREAIAAAAAWGATLAWPARLLRGSRPPFLERRDLYPQGVASGDPLPDSVLLWTRRPPGPDGRAARELIVEIADTSDFRRSISTARTVLSPDNDWTCRVLAAGLEPSCVYWYRFTDDQGFGSRVGRAVTAPAATDASPLRFAFVSCQNMQQGAANAYRRMIFEDTLREKKDPKDRLAFVLHLGDFVYEVVWYPEDRPQGMYDRKLRDIVRYGTGEKIADFHVPTSLEDYRALYRAYLLDPDLQDARARFPFVYMWDNHEFSWKCWQSQESFGDVVKPAQTRKVAANQAWFEYQPARVRKADASGGDRYIAPAVADRPLRSFDDSGLGQEAGNLAAIRSLEIFRAMRWGRNVELFLTDNRSFRSQPIMDAAESVALRAKEFPYFTSLNVVETLDAGRTNGGGHPPATIRFGGADVPNPRRDAPAQSMLGGEQKRWFLGRLRDSKTPWKLWGNTVATLDIRADLHRLPPGPGPRWPDDSYGLIGDDDWSGYRTERAEIFETVRRNRITGFVSLAGDRHSFQAGLVSAALPPKSFDPVGAEFVTGSISAPGLAEAAGYKIAKNDPLRPLYLWEPSPGASPKTALNFTAMHGVRASLALQSTGDLKKALSERNPEVAPHLSFLDWGGHGYAAVRVTEDELEVEFVCVPRPIERSSAADGGPLAYRVAHRVRRWSPGEAPRVERSVVEGELPLVV